MYKLQYDFSTDKLTKTKSLLEIRFVRRITRKIGEIASEMQKGNKSMRRTDRSTDDRMTVKS